MYFQQLHRNGVTGKHRINAFSTGGETHITGKIFSHMPCRV